MTLAIPEAMTDDDFSWAARLMERRRELYAGYSPVFWRPARGIVDFHAQFLALCGQRAGAVALRTAHGFVISYPQQGCCFVDDFAVDEPARWATEGRALLLAAWQRARSSEQRSLRVVSACRDEPKRDMLIALGLHAATRWWVKELTPGAPAQPFGPLALGGVAGDVQLVRAPPVYDPGGPVCLLGSLDSAHAAVAAERAAAAGAVLAIVQRESSGEPVPASDPVLEAAGYHNPAAFFQGQP